MEMFLSIVVAGTGISQVAKKIPLAAIIISAPIINEVILFIGTTLSVLLLAASKKSFAQTF